MSERAPFQVLILPFRQTGLGGREFALFRRSDSGDWQGIAGGGDRGESPLLAAGREMEEESGLPRHLPLIPLDTMTMIPKFHFQRNESWNSDILVIPEFSFGVDVSHYEIVLSHEHTETGWFSPQSAFDRLKWDSNKVALWELDQRLQYQLFRPSTEMAALKEGLDSRFLEHWRGVSQGEAPSACQK